MKGYGPAGPGAQRGPGGAGARPPLSPQRADPYPCSASNAAANDRDIKRAYRKLISQHHPDKLGDVPDELKRRAEERAREINAAYERVKAERGFK